MNGYEGKYKNRVKDEEKEREYMVRARVTMENGSLSCDSTQMRQRKRRSGPRRRHEGRRCKVERGAHVTNIHSV